ncbi:MAG TPA: hypothetical protein VM095_16315 [Pyrinomonadaceae bacterium]|nr:hypothetical protein [Pyrinomonadaceae bacterium]
MNRTVLLLGALLLTASTCAVYAQGNIHKNAPAINSLRVKAAAPALAAPDDPEAIYHAARIVHNVTVNGKKGMRVHANFTVKYGLDNPCKLIAYFYYDDADNQALEADDPKYRTAEGKVSASTNFTPQYDPALYKDLQLFIPYEALNLESGDVYDLKFYLALYDQSGGRFFGKSGWYKFKVTMP